MSRRIRTIKPEITESESFARCSRDARLCGTYLITNADDHGRMRGNATMLARTLFPYDDDAQHLMPQWLDELEAIGFIRRYQLKGSNYLEIVNWSKHQKVDHKGASKLPSFEDRDTLANVRDDFAKPAETVPKPSETVASDLDQDQDRGSGTVDQEGDSSLRSESTPEASAEDQAFIDAVHELWTEGVTTLITLGIDDGKARKVIGRWLKDSGNDPPTVLSAIKSARHARTGSPIPYITAAIRTKPTGDARTTKVDPMMEGLERAYKRKFGDSVVDQAA
jgi:hypothetical protein